MPLRARTMVGFVPLFGAATVPADTSERFPDFKRRRDWFIAQPAGPRRERRADGRARDRRATWSSASCGRTSSGACSRRMLDEEEFLSPYGVRSVSRAHEDEPDGAPPGRAGVPAGLRAGRVPDRPLRRQLQLAGPDLDAGQFPHPARPAPVPRLLRRRVPGRVPHRLGQPDEPGAGRAGAEAPAREHLPPRRRRPAGRLRLLRALPHRSALARPRPVPRVLPRRHRPRVRRQPPDGVDGADRAGPDRPGRGRKTTREGNT